MGSHPFTSVTVIAATPGSLTAAHCSTTCTCDRRVHVRSGYSILQSGSMELTSSAASCSGTLTVKLIGPPFLACRSSRWIAGLNSLHAAVQRLVPIAIGQADLISTMCQLGHLPRLARAGSLSSRVLGLVQAAPAGRKTECCSMWAMRPYQDNIAAVSPLMTELYK